MEEREESVSFRERKKLELILKQKMKELQTLQAELQRSEQCSSPEVVIKNIIENISFKMDSDPLISKKHKSGGKCECRVF
ncbi:unnamed protein product [Blepharisma stoltei]|uniref:G protein gamma domain-containing protein n=1 Tax=Blepharisma stoltei TaxID=1481888 RepID=A0AAU9IVZ3_9CILI|nr:unnamed protein product [Blepharisma stoltei]